MEVPGGEVIPVIRDGLHEAGVRHHPRVTRVPRVGPGDVGIHVEVHVGDVGAREHCGHIRLEGPFHLEAVAEDVVAHEQAIHRNSSIFDLEWRDRGRNHGVVGDGHIRRDRLCPSEAIPVTDMDEARNIVAHQHVRTFDMDSGTQRSLRLTAISADLDGLDGDVMDEAVGAKVDLFHVDLLGLTVDLHIRDAPSVDGVPGGVLTALRRVASEHLHHGAVEERIGKWSGVTELASVRTVHGSQGQDSVTVGVGVGAGTVVAGVARVAVGVVTIPVSGTSASTQAQKGQQQGRSSGAAEQLVKVHSSLLESSPPRGSFG